MRILLVNVGDKTEVRIPQGLVYLASAVQAAGHTVTIHDEVLAAGPEQSLDKILASDADVIGMSVYSSPPQLRRVEQISQAIKTTRKHTLVIWGGWHPTLYPRYSILNENVDIVVRGPGEKPLSEFLDALEHSRSFRNISGLLLKKNGRIIETGPVCLDTQYLYPDLNFRLVDLDAYLKRHDGGPGILQYITSRGCRHTCRFCAMARLFKGCLIRKPRDQVVNELRSQLKDCQVKTIHFSDDNAFGNDTEAADLCDIVTSATEGRGIPWRCTTRIDTLCHLSDEAYERLVASGCKGFVVGIESGADRVLRLMGKRITVSQIHKALECMKAKGVNANLFFFLLGFTSETEEEACETLRLARTARSMFPGSDIHFSVYFPGFVDASWLPENVPATRLSRILEQRYAKHRANCRLAGRSLNVVRYYFGASKRKISNDVGRVGCIRGVYQKLLMLRIRYGVFVVPFEYYLHRIARGRIRKILNRIRVKRSKQNSLEQAK